MDWKIFFATCGSIFLAELGDKTQLATMSLSAESKATWAVFFGALAAFVLSTTLAVIFGRSIQAIFPVRYIRLAAAVAFIVIGVSMLRKG